MKKIIIVFIILWIIGNSYGCSGWQYLDNGSSVAYKYNPDGTINDTMYMPPPTQQNNQSLKGTRNKISLDEYETK